MPRFKSISPFILLLVWMIGCSSPKETIKEPAPAVAEIQPPPTEPPKPLVEPPLDTLSLAPEELSVEAIDSLLQRTQSHLARAEAAFAQNDSVHVAKNCELALGIIDRLSYHPGIDTNATFISLWQSLIDLYQKAAPSADKVDWEMSISALRSRIDVDLGSVDIHAVTFTPPPPTVIPLPLNEPVEQNIVYFATKARHVYTRWLERSGRFFPRMKQILKEEGLPEELVFLSMIESGLNPAARSWAKCVGLWQFLKSTGEAYGLRGDWYSDDRRDPEKSTRAAARHLRDLFNRYNDWQLALAAYNAGAGRIDRAVQQCDSAAKTYWNVRSLLPKETQNYVPIFTAAAIIGLNPAAYGFTSIEYQEPLDYDVVTVTKCVKLADVAVAIGISEEELYEYNTNILQTTTPPDARGFDIKVPRGKADALTAALGNIPEHVAPQWIVHHVKRGDNLKMLAHRYGVSYKSIMQANKMRRVRKLKKGESIRIPVVATLGRNRYETAVDNQRNPTKPNTLANPMSRTKGREQLEHELLPQQTLGDVAKRYSVNVSDLLVWNQLRPEEKVDAGRKLKVWVRSLADSNAWKRNSGESKIEPPQEGLRAQSIATQSTETTTIKAHAVAVEPAIQQREPAPLAASIAGAISQPIAGPSKPDDSAATSQAPADKSGASNPALTKVSSTKETNADKNHAPTPKEVAIAAQSSVATQSERRDPDPLPNEHIVLQGETLWRIAQKYHITIEQLKEWNAFEDEAIQTGQRIALRPTGGATRSESESRMPSSEFYTVQSKDNLYSLSKQFNCSVDELRTWNELGKKKLQAGMTIRVRQPNVNNTQPMPTHKQTSDARATVAIPLIHVVQLGDRLLQISRLYKVTVDSLRRWNNLNSDEIRVGQELIVDRAGAHDQPTASSIKEQKNYFVEDGDTYYAIARKLGLNPTDLQRWNHYAALRKGDKIIYY